MLPRPAIEALAAEVPNYYHCELVRDAEGRRLAKRDGANRLVEDSKGFSTDQ